MEKFHFRLGNLCFDLLSKKETEYRCFSFKATDTYLIFGLRIKGIENGWRAPHPCNNGVYKKDSGFEVHRFVK